MRKVFTTALVAMAMTFGAADAAKRLPVQVVANVKGAMPTGIAVSANGRIFLNFPQWGDNSPFAVGEWKKGRLVPFPATDFNRINTSDPTHHLISVQSLITDGVGRLWVLDTGTLQGKGAVAGGGKLVAIDLASDAVVKTIVLPPDIMVPGTYLNDLRIDLRQGKGGVAYITDSNGAGPSGLIVVDLESGTAMRRLAGYATVLSDPDFSATIEGKPVVITKPDGKPQPWRVAADGIAISPDGATLYYCALTSRHFYAVPTALLRDPAASDDKIARSVKDLGPKAPSDGLAEDDQGRLYAGDYEHNAIRRYENGEWQTIAQDKRILWPDSLALGTDGYLYVTANQLHRQAQFQGGKDLRKQPYQVLRIKIGAKPLLLK